MDFHSKSPLLNNTGPTEPQRGKRNSHCNENKLLGKSWDWATLWDQLRGA